jgi:hypothetical protein
MNKKEITYQKQKFHAFFLIILLLFYAYLESKDVIEPKQYHSLEQNFSYPISSNMFFVSITGSAVASGVTTSIINENMSYSILGEGGEK